MAILNYTTSISTEKTAAEIQKKLVTAKAQAVLCEYDDDGNILFKPKRPWQRFCTTPGSNCRLKWHQEYNLPGVVKRLQKVAGGKWSVTIHFPTQPTVDLGTRVALDITCKKTKKSHE